MNIACIVSLVWEVPPAQYGGTERVMATLVRGLESRGHTMTLYAAGGSTATKNIRTTQERHLGGGVTLDERLSANLKLAHLLQSEQAEYDVIISFCDEAILPITSSFKTPVLHSLHMPFLDYNIPVFREYADLQYIALSEAQKQPLLDLNYVATIHNGIVVEDVPFTIDRGKKLVYLGTIHPWKGVHLLRDIALRHGYTIHVAGQIADASYYQAEIEPYLGSAFEYYGEFNDVEKYAFFTDAAALVYPVQIRDTCPITILEASAAGLPVIALANGAIPELVKTGQNGIVVHDMAQMEAVISEARYTAIDPLRCRTYALQHFSAEQMVTAYIDACHKAIRPVSKSAALNAV